MKHDKRVSKLLEEDFPKKQIKLRAKEHQEDSEEDAEDMWEEQDEDAKQIAKLKYIPKNNGKLKDKREHFIGYTIENGKDVEVPLLSPAWVRYQFDPNFVALAMKAPFVIMTVPLGRAKPVDTVKECPYKLKTNVKTVYPQGHKNVCLMHSFASCLHYCGLIDESVLLLELADELSNLSQEHALNRLCFKVKEIAPVIGQCQKFNIRNAKKKKISRIDLEDQLPN